ncbi:MAG TPA: NAD(P)-dependent oxidoreductase [Steroidobacteraceae bacterium]|nr:NAD(P)-dependent oxidoreductase [Steroidobacteraceae bacterium]
MKALVTGANGFLGQSVVAALLAQGHSVRAFVRPTTDVQKIGWPDSVEIVRGDLRSARELASAFAGVDVLVHLAAAVTGGDEAQFASTVTGTERLLTAMAETACRRIVLASSFSVYDWSVIRGTLDERSPLATGAALYRRDGYAIAKAWQERITRRFAAQHGWDLTVLRPGYIWGRDHGYLGGLGQRVGRLHIVVGPFSHLPLTHVDNCADLFARAASDPRAVGQTINVVDGPGERIWGYLGDHLKGTGERGTRVPVPYFVAFNIVRLAFATILKRNEKLPGLLIPCRFEARMKPLRFTNHRAQELLGWHPPYSYAECLRRTYGSQLTEHG